MAQDHDHERWIERETDREREREIKRKREYTTSPASFWASSPTIIRKFLFSASDVTECCDMIDGKERRRRKKRGKSGLNETLLEGEKKS